MAGYREFQTGEVLTAANVNDFLMEQAVMTFADATARTSALAGVLREGLLTYNLDTNRLEVYDGSAWVEPAPEPPAGIGSQVVQTVRTDTFSATLSLGEVSTDAMTASITPTSATSRILVIVDANVSSANVNSYVYLYRDGSPSAFRGDADGSRVRVASGGGHRVSGGRGPSNAAVVYLDSPATTSSVTYSVRLGHDRTAAGTDIVYLNRGALDDNDAFAGRAASSITLIEVAA